MAALVFVSVLWAFSFGLIRRYLVSLDSATVALLRLALCCLVFAPWLRCKPLTASMRWGLMAIGAIQFGLMYILYIEAFHFLQAYQVAVLTLLTPLFVCVFDALLERRFSGLAFASACLAAVGAFVVVGGRALGHAQWWGVLLIQTSNASFALGQLLYRRFRLRHDRLSDMVPMPWLYLGAASFALPFASRHLQVTSLSMTMEQLLVVSYLGVVASGVGFYLWNLGAVRVEAGTLAVMNNAKIPLGVVVSLLVFGERANLTRLFLGALIVLGALLLAARETATSHGERRAKT